MSDTAKVFGTTYTGVTALKVSDGNSGTLTYIRPTGTKSITSNGEGIDVSAYQYVDVSVDGGDSGGGGNVTISQDANGYIVVDSAAPSGGGTDYLIANCNGTLTSYNNNSVTFLRKSCFRDCTTLTSLKVYNCTTLDSLCLYNTHIEKIAFPSLTSVATQSLSNFGSGYLKEVDLGPNCESLNNQGLTNNSALTIIILRRFSIVALNNISVFNNTPFADGGTGGTIYIPESLYNHLGDNSTSDYRAASNWSTVYAYGTVTFAKIEGSKYETEYADGTAIVS